MSRAWKTFTTLLAISSLAALVVLPLGEQRQLSVEAWLTAVACLLAISIIAKLFAAAPVKAAELATLWRRNRSEEIRSVRLPRNLATLEGMLVSARDNRRAFDLRLHPRLVDVADHYLRTDHGTDQTVQRERTEEILGESSWLVDETESSDRTPELAEVEELLDRLLAKRTAQRLPDLDSTGRSPHDEEQS